MAYWDAKLIGIIFDTEKSQEVILNGKNKDRKDLANTAINLLEHHNHSYIPPGDLELEGHGYYKCRHEFSQDDLIGLGLFNQQDFYENKKQRDRFKGAKIDDNWDVMARKNPILTKPLKGKLDNLYKGFYNSEVIARAVDRSSGKLIHSEFLDFEFCGKTYRQYLEKLKGDKNLLLLPEWRLFIQDSEYASFPIVARHYDNHVRGGLFPNHSTSRKFSSDSIGKVVMGISKEYAQEKFKKLGISLQKDGQYSEIGNEPHVPISLKLSSSRPFGMFGCY